MFRRVEMIEIEKHPIQNTELGLPVVWFSN
jgi:hypothetical protein